jgi:survival-of-motor-neuron-related-splicing factor 30
MAKWVTGDKAFYAARILSITGSKADPIYTVRFKAYDQQETIRSHDIRAMASDSKKRKAETTPSTPTITTSSNSNTISAAANINPDLVRKEPSKVSDGPARPAKVAKKIKATKELEAGKSKWQDFAAKGKFGKMTKKDSMFKTGEGVTARVGFVGSGTTMRQDPTRKRHVYDQRAEEED